MDERCRFQKISVIPRQSFKILVLYLQFFFKGQGVFEKNEMGAGGKHWV